MRHHHTALIANPAVTSARFFMLAELDPLIGGTPIPSRWGLLVGWVDDLQRDHHLAHGGTLDPFIAGARESWSVSLEPLRVRPRDSLHGWRPSTSGVLRSSPNEPVMVMTYGHILPRHLPAFSWHNQKIVRLVRSNPAVVMSVGILDHPMSRATFSLWRSRRAATTFAYRDEPHNGVQRRSLAVPRTDHHFFASFRPTASTGSWLAKDPLADCTHWPRRGI